MKNTCLELREHVVDEIIGLALGRVVLTWGRVYIVCRAAGITISLLLLLCDLTLALLGQTRHGVGLCIGGVGLVRIHRGNGISLGILHQIVS